MVPGLPGHSSLGGQLVAAAFILAYATPLVELLAEPKCPCGVVDWKGTSGLPRMTSHPLLLAHVTDI